MLITCARVVFKRKKWVILLWKTLKLMFSTLSLFKNKLKLNCGNITMGRGYEY